MLADSAPIFSTETFLIQKFRDNNGLVKKKNHLKYYYTSYYYSYYTTTTNPTYNRYNTHGHISSSGLILYLVQYDEENLSENQIF